MARQYRFIQVDVFTDHIFGGNPLAVFLEPDGLSGDEMQAIAMEMNLSETTFVFPPSTPEGPPRVRIFTTARELPFAGHPTVGTAWVLANRGQFPANARELTLEESIGPVPVRLEGDVRAPSVVWMSHRDAEFGPPLANRAEIASALGLSDADLLTDKPIQTGSTGVSFLYVPLRTAEAVDRAQPNWSALPPVEIGVFVFAPDPARGDANVYSRMFATGLGISEDPATGSASGPLGAYLVEHNVLDLDFEKPVEIVSLQGNKMGRPSLIHIRLGKQNGRATNIQVGGGVVPVLEGELTLP